jgi:hypothetical protein
MSDSTILQRYGSGSPDVVVEALRPEEEQLASDYGCFGWLRGSRERAVMLELRKKNGNILAVGYGWLERADYNPSEGITLHVSGRRIRITGRNLNGGGQSSMRLFEGITRHRVSWMQEAGEPEQMDAISDAPIIDAIEW